MNLNKDNLNFGSQVSNTEGKKLVSVLNKKLRHFKSIGKLE